MKILLMRHGEAVDQADGMTDGERWLTAKGRRVSREVAAQAVLHIRPAAVWTSPLVRATQTAEILVNAAGIEGDVSVVREIATDNVQVILTKLRAWQGETPLALVGHEPTLSTLAMTLLGERRWSGFEKSSVCALSLERDAPTARFEWMLLAKKVRLVEDLQKLIW